ncbi:MAG: acyl-CoA dehydrogenase family protein [Thermodesulfobacteriota bacterium]|nr:acyl-CoA dehydrogenase family protein [Thermodesulfobacteriota bacterium]
MDLSLDKEQKMIKESAREFLEKECTSDMVREMEEDERGYSPDLWRKMVELCWMGLIYPDKYVPQEYGGSGGDFFDLIILFEEMGRYLVPAPFLETVILGGLTVLYGGSEEQKKELLPAIAKGEKVFTMALIEEEAGFDASCIKMRAVREGDRFYLKGTKLFVPYAHVADHLICVTRTEDSENKEDGITLFLVDAKDPAINYTVLNTLAGDKQCEVVLKQIEVTEEDMIGEYNQGWKIIAKVLQQAAIAQCAFMVGGAERVLEMTVSYAKERVQFGRPIGSYQAIQHHCANMMLDLDGAKFITYEAAWRLSKGLPYTTEVSASKAWTNQAYRRICANGHQIHGGTGVITEQDLQLFSRRAKSAEFYWGDTDFHREIVARQIGL